MKLPFVLQERDRQIVRLVAEYRLITSAEIQALISGSQQAALRRLQRLYHGGYLERPPDQRFRGNGRMVYALGPAGAQMFAAEGRTITTDADQARSIGVMHIDHALSISRFHAILALAVRQRGDVALELWRQDRELWDRVTVTQRGQNETIPVCPDAYFVLRLAHQPEGKNRIHVFAEIDRSTMTTKRFVTKMRGYWHYRLSGRQTERHGMKNFIVLTVTKTPERAVNLMAATKSLKEASAGLRMFLFGREQDFSLDAPRNILEAIWTSPGDPQPHSILE